MFASKTDAGTKIRDGILTDDEAHYNFSFCLPCKTKILDKQQAENYICSPNLSRTN